MQVTDIDVVNGMREWIKAEQPFWLCSIVSTYGSSPRPVGSIFAWNGESKLGSISGGCLEEAFISKLNRDEFSCYPCQFTYGKDLVSQEAISELPCGGTIQLLIEKITPTHDNQRHIEDWRKMLMKRVPFVRRVSLTGTESVIEGVNEVNTSIHVDMNEEYVAFSYHQVWRLLILGISQVSECTARLAKMLGFTVAVCDIREELAPSWLYSKSQDGVDITWQYPDVFVESNVDSLTAVVALAHDPKVDDIGLMSALSSKAFYVGAMGSSRTTDARIKRLRKFSDLSPEKIETLRAPIGFQIGSKTPMEIAVSIMSEILAVRSGSHFAV